MTDTVEQPTLRVWATRSAGVIGLLMASIYLGVIVGEDDGLTIVPILWFAVMAGTGLVAWFADRADFVNGRKMAIGAMVAFLALGVLGALTIGIGFLAAALLCLVGFSGVARQRVP